MPLAAFPALVHLTIFYDWTSRAAHPANATIAEATEDAHWLNKRMAAANLRCTQLMMVLFGDDEIEHVFHFGIKLAEPDLEARVLGRKGDRFWGA